MPVKTLHTSSEAKKYYKSISYETLLASWLVGYYKTVGKSLCR